MTVFGGFFPIEIQSRKLVELYSLLILFDQKFEDWLCEYEVECEYVAKLIVEGKSLYRSQGKVWKPTYDQELESICHNCAQAYNKASLDVKRVMAGYFLDKIELQSNNKIAFYPSPEFQLHTKKIKNE